MRKFISTGLVLAAVGSFLVVGSAFAIPITGALAPLLSVGYEKSNSNGRHLIEMFDTGTLSSAYYDPTPVSISFPGQGALNATSPGIAAVATSPVPEPSTMLLFGTALVGLAGVARRRKKD